MAGCGKSRRVREVVDCAWWKLRMDHPGVPDHELVRDAWVHISQEVDRLPISRPNAPCLVANSVVYSLERDTTISGRGLMMCMGWPEQYVECDDIVSDAELRDIAGNSSSCPIACIISPACIMNRFGSWWS